MPNPVSVADAIVTPSPQQEQPRVGVLVAVSLSCFALGYVVTATIGAAATPATSVADHASPTQPAPEPSPVAASAASVTEPAPAIEPAPVIEPGPATEPAPVVARKLRPPAPPPLVLIQGRVAYLRCDGLAAESGRFPCPRDLELERAVWDILAGLPSCAPSLGRGMTDVRLELARGKVTLARVSETVGSLQPALDADAVYACVGEKLTRQRSTLDPLYMLVSFRAALR